MSDMARIGETQKLVIEHLSKSWGGLTPEQIACSLRVSDSTTGNALERLRNTGLVDAVDTPSGRLYWLSDAGVAVAHELRERGA